MKFSLLRDNQESYSQYSPDSSLHRAYNSRRLLTNGNGLIISGDLDTEDTSDTVDSVDSLQFVNMA